MVLIYWIFWQMRRIIDRFVYEALHDGKTDELCDGKKNVSKGILYCPSSRDSLLLSDLERFIDKKHEKTIAKKANTILGPERIFRDKDFSTSYGKFIQPVQYIEINTTPNTNRRENPGKTMTQSIFICFFLKKYV